MDVPLGRGTLARRVESPRVCVVGSSEGAVGAIRDSLRGQARAEFLFTFLH